MAQSGCGQRGRPELCHDLLCHHSITPLLDTDELPTAARLIRACDVNYAFAHQAGPVADCMYNRGLSKPYAQITVAKNILRQEGWLHRHQDKSERGLRSHPLPGGADHRS